MIKAGDIFNQVRSSITYTHEVLRIYNCDGIIKAVMLTNGNDMCDIQHDMSLRTIYLNIHCGCFTHPLYPEFFIENETIS